MRSDAPKTCKGVRELRIRTKNFAGLLERPDVLYSDGWPVSETYKIAGGWIYPEGGSEWSAGQLQKTYEDPNLFLSFARLGSHGEPSEKSILEWVSRYGLLHAQKGEFLVPAPGTVADFRANVLCAYQLLGLHVNIKTRNIDALRAMVVKAKRHPSSEWPTTPSTTVEKHLAAVREDFAKLGAEYERDVERYRKAVANGWLVPPETDDGWSDDDVVDFASIGLRSVLKEQVGEIRLGFGEHREHPERGHETEHVAHRGYDCPDLLSAIYLQLYLFITDNKPLRHCKACGEPFVLTRKDKWFCNPTCRSRARRYR